MYLLKQCGQQSFPVHIECRGLYVHTMEVSDKIDRNEKLLLQVNLGKTTAILSILN
jgi:hypothetical protein